ncbi:hypothetical protein [Muribaculum intestinale]|nr:hypothetical protein [Muribaculum intestinale]
MAAHYVVVKLRAVIERHRELRHGIADSDRHHRLIFLSDAAARHNKQQE